MPTWLAIAIFSLLSLPPPKPIRLEAEAAQLVGVHVATSRKGYSGTGYVTGFDHDGARIVFTTQAQAGIYEARIGYSAPFGEKGYGLVVNGTVLSGMFPGTGDAFAVHAAGKIALRSGVNTLAIEKGWGYYDIDYLELTPAAAPRPLHKPSKTLSDPKATASARALMRSLVGRYGSGTLSGQYDHAESDYIRAITGRIPALLGDDFMDYSPSRIARGAQPDRTTEGMIAAARAGQIVTMSWHWNAPKDLLDREFTNARGETVDARWYKGFYTYATTFDVQRALADPGSEDYRLLLRDMDAIAVQLQKFAAADIPVLWRPLHEAEGGWFWWGAKGPDAFKKLWRLLYDRLTRLKSLHNLIWVYNGVKPEWYPGDAYVDIVGVDAYPSDPGDPLSETWEALLQRFDGRKLLAVTEFGGVPDVETMRRYGVRWAYFVSWTGDLGPKKLSKEALARLYRSPAVINRDGLRPAIP